MTWLVELPDLNGQPILVNLDEPVLVQGDGAQCSIVTSLGPVGVGLDYASLCERLRLNPADRMASAARRPVGRALGRLPAKRDCRVPRLAALAPALPAAPARYSAYVDTVRSWILGENDRIGDCTCVGVANVILGLSTLAGDAKRLTDAEIVDFYASVSGYTPGNPDSDQGAMIEDVLSAWHERGIAMDRLDGYASIEPSDHARTKQAIALLGPVDIGINLPNGWMQAQTWDVATAGAGIAGGHCVTAVGYDEAGLQVVSWGQVFTMSWAGWDGFVDEAHALLSRDALTKAGRDVGGIDWADLENFMRDIKEAQ